MDGKTNEGVYNPKNLSMFSYAYNNPVNLVDPDGNAPWGRVPRIGAGKNGIVKLKYGGRIQSTADGAIDPSKSILPRIPNTKANNQKVKPGDTGSYGKLKAQKRKNGETEPLHMDHQPSLAAQIKNRENTLGAKLSHEQKKALKSNAPAVASPRKIHQQTSPTYGGRNTPSRIAEDAKDLNTAQARDRGAFDKAMKSRGE